MHPDNQFLNQEAVVSSGEEKNKSHILHSNFQDDSMREGLVSSFTGNQIISHEAQNGGCQAGLW